MGRNQRVSDDEVERFYERRLRGERLIDLAEEAGISSSGLLQRFRKISAGPSPQPTWMGIKVNPRSVEVQTNADKTSSLLVPVKIYGDPLDEGIVWRLLGYQADLQHGRKPSLQLAKVPFQLVPRNARQIDFIASDVAERSTDTDVKLQFPITRALIDRIENNRKSAQSAQFQVTLSFQLRRDYDWSVVVYREYTQLTIEVERWLELLRQMQSRTTYAEFPTTEIQNRYTPSFEALIEAEADLDKSNFEVSLYEVEEIIDALQTEVGALPRSKIWPERQKRLESILKSIEASIHPHDEVDEGWTRLNIGLARAILLYMNSNH